MEAGEALSDIAVRDTRVRSENGHLIWQLEGLCLLGWDSFHGMEGQKLEKDMQ